MKTTLLLIIFLTTFSVATNGQDLTGAWQGLEFNPGAPTSESWPSLLTISQSANALSGTLLQIAASETSVYVKFKMDGTVANRKNVSLAHQSVVEDRGNGLSWCYGNYILTYDEAQEKLSGIATYPSLGCAKGTVELYRIRLKSPSEFCKGQSISLLVTGKEVKWYADYGKQKLLRLGNTFAPKLPASTTFYVTQTHYGVESPVVEILIKIIAPVISSLATVKTTFGQATGEVKIKATGNVPLTYRLNQGSFQKLPSFKKLAQGAYSVTVMDARGCYTTSSFKVDTVRAPLKTSKENDFSEKAGLPKVNEKVVLNNVLFKKTTVALLPSSFEELDKLAGLMVQNPTIEIRLEGHTDKGSDMGADLQLSVERTDVVKQYLVTKGVLADRIICKGFGNTKLLHPSPNQANRRVEFVVIKE